MAIRLGDDGTMDTVLVCTDCGEEMRYNFDSDNGPELEDERAQAYDEWVDSIIEDSDHVCPSYFVTTWFERDRAHVALYFGHDEDVNDSELIVEWWDDAVAEAVEDGFLNPRDYLASALDYARSVGLAK